MSDTAPPLPAPITFTYRDDERSRFQDLAWQRASRGMPWEPFWGTLAVMVFVIGLAALGANKAGLVPGAQLPAVLATAYIAFAAGVCVMIFLYYRQRLWLARHAAGNRDAVAWELAFGDAGFTYKSTLFETSVPWRSVTSIEPLPEVVFIWFGPAEALTIPARVFADDSARKLFVTALRARIGKPKGQQTQEV
jgi:hypothetical protein